MKKFNLMKTVILLFAVLAFSSCEEDGAIQFVVVDDFPTPIDVEGLLGQSSYSVNDTADISALLDGAATFVDANVESITLELQGYSGASIDGNIKVSIGSLILFDQSVILSTTPTVIAIPDNASDILNFINSGSVNITMEGTTADPIEDNDFIILVTARVKGTVEQ